MIRIQQLNLEILPFSTEEEYDKYQYQQLEQKILKILKISPEVLISFTIVRRSLDARKKPTLFYSYIVDVEVTKESQILQKNKSKNKKNMLKSGILFKKNNKKYIRFVF